METLYLNLKGRSIEDKIEILETVEWGFNQIGEEAEISLNGGSVGMVTAISVDIDQENITFERDGDDDITYDIATINDMTLIDKTKNSECPKRTDLERLKKAIKEKNQ